MDANAARKFIHDRFIANFPVAEPTVPFSFTNESADMQDQDACVLLHVQHEDSQAHTLAPEGSRVFDRRGRIFIQAYARVDAGLQRADQLCKRIRDYYEGKSFDGIYFFVGSQREVGPIDGKFLCTVAVPFSYDELK